MAMSITEEDSTKVNIIIMHVVILCTYKSLEEGQINSTIFNYNFYSLSENSIPVLTII